MTILKVMIIVDDYALSLDSIGTKFCPTNCNMAGVSAEIVKIEAIWNY